MSTLDLLQATATTKLGTYAFIFVKTCLAYCTV